MRNLLLLGMLLVLPIFQSSLVHGSAVMLDTAAKASSNLQRHDHANINAMPRLYCGMQMGGWLVQCCNRYPVCPLCVPAKPLAPLRPAVDGFAVVMRANALSGNASDEGIECR